MSVKIPSDPVTNQPLLWAITVHPCGHVLNESTAMRAQWICPLDQQPITTYSIEQIFRDHVSHMLSYGNQLPPTGNPLPANYFPVSDLTNSSVAGAAYETAFQEVISVRNLNLNQVSPKVVGEQFCALFHKYAPTSLRVFDDQNVFAGSATLLSPSLVLTARHLFSSNHRYKAISTLGQIVELKWENMRMFETHDYCLIQLEEAMGGISNFPLLDYANSEWGAYGMMHYADRQQTPHVTIGEGSGISQEVFQPMLAIDGGKGASGALVWRANETATSLHIGTNPEFALRSSIFIHEIISDELARCGDSWILDYARCTEELGQKSHPFPKDFTPIYLDLEGKNTRKTSIVTDALTKRGWYCSRHGGRHDIWINGRGGEVQIPRHTEIKDGTARGIIKKAAMCDEELEVSPPQQEIKTLDMQTFKAQLEEHGWFLLTKDKKNEKWTNMGMEKAIDIPIGDMIDLTEAQGFLAYAEQNPD